MYQVCLILIFSSLASSKWIGRIKGENNHFNHNIDLVDDVDDFDYVLEREEIMSQTNQVSDSSEQRVKIIAASLPTAQESMDDLKGVGFDEDDYQDDEDIFFKGVIRRE
jgi:hypothetical protein